MLPVRAAPSSNTTVFAPEEVTMLSTPVILATVSTPSVTETVPSACTLSVRFEVTFEKSSVSIPAPVSRIVAASAPMIVSSPAPVRIFSMFVMLPAYVAVPPVRSTTTPAASADRSSVSVPPPPSTESTAPPSNEKMSLSSPPSRSSISSKGLPLNRPLLSALITQLFAELPPLSRSCPWRPSIRPVTRAPLASRKLSDSAPPMRFSIFPKNEPFRKPVSKPLTSQVFILSSPTSVSLPPPPA